MNASKLALLVSFSAALAACGDGPKAKKQAAAPQEETKATMTSLVEGQSGKCPQLVGYYSCTEGAESSKLEIKQSTEQDGAQYFISYETEKSKPGLVDQAIGKIANKWILDDGKGMLADGKIQDRSLSVLGQTAVFKYVVKCSDSSISLHLVTSDGAIKTTYSSLGNNQGLKISGTALEEDKLSKHSAVCIPAEKPQESSKPSKKQTWWEYFFGE